MNVYLSSSYRDLQSHRTAVLQALRRMGHHALGMEDYVAEGRRPLQRCLDDVKACDVYVLVVAWRYGHLLDAAGVAGATLPDGVNAGSTSMTEAEFRQAVASGKPILVFLLDPQAPWPSDQFDAITGDGERGDYVTYFRQTLGQQYLVNYFRTPEELAGLVSAALYRVEMSRQLDLESLSIEARFNEDRIRTDPVYDSTVMHIQDVITGPEEHTALRIDLGRGRNWWMTRLYFLTSLAVDLTAVETVVFLATNDKFVGIIDPRIITEKLAGLDDRLQQYADQRALGSPPHADLAQEVQQRASDWSGIVVNEEINPTFVTQRAMKRWLAPYLITQAVAWDDDTPTALQMQRLLDWPNRFVPVTEDGRFTRVVDKRAFTEQIARLFVREQVNRAVSMTR